jgi:hypothetical protein
MARRRFSDLERISDALRLANADVANLPANLDFVKYEKWKRGEAPAATITRPALNGEIEVGITAFGLDATDDSSKLVVTMTGRSHTFIGNLIGVTAKLGYIVPTVNHQVNGSFVSAKARIAVKQAGTTQTSRITGRRYKDGSGAAYTGAFGQTTTEKYYQSAIQSILASAPFNATPQTHLISFSPEQWRRD